ncbi:hypothetical protein D3C78_1656810 [compost metagenome]
MFDRCEHPAKGRQGGLEGAAGRVSLSDGTALKPKGTQQVPEGSTLVLELPGGGGHGAPAEREHALVQRDIEYGYITEAEAVEAYGYQPTQAQ